MTITTASERLFPHCSAKHIQDLELRLDNKTSTVLNEAELALRSLSLTNPNKQRDKAIIDTCLRYESIANLYMSGHMANVEELLRSGVLKPYCTNSHDERIKVELLRNIDAFRFASEHTTYDITPDLMNEINNLLLTGSRDIESDQTFRTENKMTDAQRYMHVDIAHTEPDVETIPELLEDLAEFCNLSTMPAIAQAAIAHAQFVCIHPYHRANGKTARALNHLIFARRGICDLQVIPVSLSMALSPRDYHATITSTVQNLMSDKLDYDDLNRWIRYFATCCIYAANQVEQCRNTIYTMRESWTEAINPRVDSATCSLIHELPGIPVFTAEIAAEYIGRSYKRTNAAIADLLGEGIIEQISRGKRNRVFQCPEVVQLYQSTLGM